MHTSGPFKTYGNFYCSVMRPAGAGLLCQHGQGSVSLTTPRLYVSVRGKTEVPAKMSAKAVFKRPLQWT